MKKLISLLLLALIYVSHAASASHHAPFNKVIIWGHKLHSHTHSYVHNAFYRAFKHLGYDTYWFDNHDNVRNFDFSNSLFITESQVDHNIPLRSDCRYILHNCTMTKYKKLFDAGNCIILQVYTHDVLPRKVKKLDTCIYQQIDDKVIYIPWATDLLPHEIDAVKQHIPLRKHSNIVYWIGTLAGGTFGNDDKCEKFARACRENHVQFKHVRSVSVDENIRYVQESVIAPTLVGEWQCRQGYIPCRIFKNISYGQMGVTNSKMVYELFEGKVIYNPDCYQLFYDAKKYIDHMNINELFELMDVVKNKHTYINRIYDLLDFMHLIKPLPGYEPYRKN